DRRVDAKFAGEPAAFLVRACAADDVAAAQLRYLYGDRTHRARRRRDEDLLAVLQLPDLEQAAVGHEPRASERMQVHAHGQRRVDGDHRDAAAVGHVSLTVPVHADDDVALAVIWMTRLLDAPESEAPRRRVERLQRESRPS